jgi:hypothetical protein
MWLLLRKDLAIERVLYAEGEPEYYKSMVVVDNTTECIV